MVHHQMMVGHMSLPSALSTFMRQRVELQQQMMEGLMSLPSALPTFVPQWQPWVELHGTARGFLALSL